MAASVQDSLEVVVRQFLKSKRTLGRKYQSEERELRLIIRCLEKQGVTTLDQLTSTAIDDFLASRPRTRARSFNHLVGVLRCLLDWAVTQQLLVVSPLRVQKRRETARRIPFLFDMTQARLLLDAAAALPDRPRGPMRGSSYRAIFGILYGLGLRAGEACGLLCGDVDLDLDILHVRGGKFGKSRFVPFGPRMATLLNEQLERRCCGGQPANAVAPLFTFDGRKTIHPGTVSQTFCRLVRTLDFPVPEGVATPRLHDLRHSFAVGTLLRWYRKGLQPASRLHHLSTFLGHVDPTSTAVYLTITMELLQEANHRYEGFAKHLWEEESR